MVKRLEASGISEKQASEIMHAIIEGRDNDLSKLATGEQLFKLHHEMVLNRKEVELNISDLRKDVVQQGVDLRKEMKFRNEKFKGEIIDAKYNLLKCIIFLLTSIIIITIFFKK